MLLKKLSAATRGKLFDRNAGFIKRWPDNPKVIFFGPPNAPVIELANR
jgi:hypothetical protein